MEILGDLPKLMLLQFWPRAYHGEKLVFGTRAFLNLTTLKIWQMYELKGIRFEEGTCPQMETIEIRYCILTSGIIGVKCLPRLKVLSLQYRSKVARLSMLEEEVNAHPNRPVLRLAQSRDFHDLGDVEGSNVEVEATESVPDHAGEISQVITQTTTDRSVNPVQ
jgi:disease resistance protein RPM1